MKKILIRTVSYLFTLILLAILLAWISNQFTDPKGWLSFLWIGLFASGCIFGIWYLMKSEDAPRWLLYLIIAAGLLRLAAGVFWTVTLPVWGHGTPAELGGYVMGDASGRDQAAWRLAESKNSLLTAFQDQRKVDQYGGQLFVSAAIYRYLGGNTHQPLLIVLLGAAISSLAIIFSWAFSRRVWGEHAAAVSAWAIALYPEAILLGSSQMREAFTIPLVAAAFFGLIKYRDDHSESSLAWIIVPFLITFFFSPLSAALLIAGLFLAAICILPSNQPGKPLPRWVWIIGAVVVLISILGVWFALRSSVPAKITNPVAMVTWWLKKSASLQSFLSQHASGWMQKIFKITPDWIHLPFLLIYGIVQPFLPAALVAGSQAPIWHGIAIWRAVGWTALLAFLVVAPIHVTKRGENRNLTRMLTFIVWMIILVAAFRGGGDLWDNPRYRALYACLQISLASKIYIDARQTRNPWLLYSMLLASSIMTWFIPWYLYRYYGFSWPITNPFHLLILGFVSGLLLIAADWFRKKNSLVNQAGESDDSWQQDPSDDRSE